MPTDAIVVLEQLHCTTLKNTEARTEPYIWPALIRIDDNTLATGGGGVAISSPSLSDARVVIKDSMRVGDAAAIPGSAGVLHARFDDNLTTRRLILVVALLEEDETPRDSMEAGYKAFVTELRAAIVANLLALNQAEADEDDEEQERIIKEIKKRVKDRVASAIEDSLSGYEKAKVFAGILNLDDIIDNNFVNFGKTLFPTPITLNFEGRSSLPLGLGESVAKFEIKGQLQLRPVRIDRCKAQADAVRAAQSVVNGVEQEIKALQAQLNGTNDPNEPDLPKDFLIQEIERVTDEELAPAVAALEKARRALIFCRNRQSVADIDPLGGVIATG